MADSIQSEIQLEPLAFSIRQTAQLAQVSEGTIRRMIRSGNLTGVRIGWVWRVPRQEVFRICEKGSKTVKKG
jgi:excisionase family DNA binding protein